MVESMAIVMLEPSAPSPPPVPSSSPKTEQPVASSPAPPIAVPSSIRLLNGPKLVVVMVVTFPMLSASSPWSVPAR